LERDDDVISMSILLHAEFGTETRDDFLRAVRAKDRLEGVADSEPDAQDVDLAARLKEPEFAEMTRDEEFILTVTENGFGKRSSAYEYRVSGRGGKGIVNIETSRRNGPVTGSFPVAESGEIMLVTDGGQLIRMPVDDIRIAGRATQGVTLFRVSEGEKVVSVTKLGDEEDEEDGAEAED